MCKLGYFFFGGGRGAEQRLQSNRQGGFQRTYHAMNFFGGLRIMAARTGIEEKVPADGERMGGGGGSFCFAIFMYSYII